MDFRQTYQTVQMKALQPIADLDGQSAHSRAAPPTQGRRGRRFRDTHSDNELDSRSALCKHLAKAVAKLPTI